MARSQSEPIAIVGSSCRFPGGASSPSKLWELLKNPRDVLVEIPPSRFNVKGFYHEDGEHHGSTNVRHSYLMEEDHRVFDHAFFNMHPREAEAIDPQQKILLETVYESVDSAGYSIQQLKGSQTAVFVGQMIQDFSDIMMRDVDSAPQYAATGLSRAIMSNRVSYFFDWKGPSSTIDTACSSSLVALHHAVQSLRSGETDLAVAAGVNLILGPEMYIFESKVHMLSPTGRSRMWDADADGYARGEGFASVVLKTLSQAVADNDHIECIIRETGVNQDGRTTGITMPSATSQTALIRSTYERAGLDLRKREDRCQYFEAHGTGTQAGDPIEAEAVRNAFFAEDDEYSDEEDADEENILHVGSIKTIIGHLEGSAGLAGVLKVSLALQHGVIPPNMHFNHLNPKIAPFYTHLRVPTTATPWPIVPPGAPRRASVNSFGFGGTNAHVILESWEPRETGTPPIEAEALPSSIGPFVLSAHSENSLVSSASALAAALRDKSALGIGDLAWTLQMRRTQFPNRINFSASTAEDLLRKLDEFVGKDREQQNSAITKGIQVSANLPPRILGVFTGQGAQWPTMGSGLYARSAAFRTSMEALDESLRTLPDPPSWSLVDEILAPTEKSRIHEAEISQPLCTALQIALVDLLRAAGISFSSVVGHSSGEIGAAYAADYITASDAIRIAYYRGMHAHLAKGPDGQEGKMLAVGMGFDEARAFCERPQFLGRIQVAASNASSSSTLSGDAEAITEARDVLDEEQLFARILKVDTAYHSHHMEPCAGPYLESLRACNIQVNQDRPSCGWYSSVYGPNGRSIDDREALKDQYWVNNMVQPVLFSQAIFRAITEENCHDIVLEVGPHPALQGPASESLKTLTGIDMPYSGALKRGHDDMDSFSNALGFIWASFLSSSPIIDFEGFRQACLGDYFSRGKVLKGLPPYSWDHDKVLWKESRVSRRFRTRENPVHELLGSVKWYGNKQEMTWRNVMRIQEMEWLRGHVFQGQVLFPAAGYVSMAFEAAMHLVDDPQQVHLVELEDLAIHRAITLDEESAGTDVTFTIRVTHRNSQQIMAEYACYGSEVDGASESDLENTNFTGRVVLQLGAPTSDSLPSRVEPKSPMTPVKTERLYSFIEKIGLRYTGDFTVESVKRRLGSSTVTLKQIPGSHLRVHPATLDASFHSLFAAYAFPGDEQLWSPYLPTSIARVRINPWGLPRPQPDKNGRTGWVADCNLQGTTSRSLCGDINLVSVGNDHVQIQVQALTCTSFTIANPQDDRKLFASTVWRKDASAGLEPGRVPPMTPEEIELSTVCDRIAYFYLRKLRDEIKPDEIPHLEHHFQVYMDWALNYDLPRIEAGLHPHVKKEWANDTRDMVLEWQQQYGHTVDLELLTAVGENQLAIVRGQLAALQLMMENNTLTRFYSGGYGFQQNYGNLETLAAQIAHKYPSMRILEVGAGTGGATVHLLKGLENQYQSYTYTDVSPGFFEAAQSRFSEHSSRMDFKVLDIERSPKEQGFEEHSYDLIMSSNALHATQSLSQTMSHCGSLLKPSGLLMLLEITNDTLRLQFIFSHLPGWWLGRDDGRPWHPTIDEARWNEILLETGFSGVDISCRDLDDPQKYYASVMISQAVDDRIQVLREPLSWTDKIPLVADLIIVGGETSRVAQLCQKTQEHLGPVASNVIRVKKLDDLDKQEVPSGATVICLSELDEPVFKNLTAEAFRGMQAIFEHAKYVLFVTQGCRAENPYSNMLVGLGRCVLLESPHLSLQFLDVDVFQRHMPEPAMFAETILRTIFLDSVDTNGLFWSNEWELAVENGDLYIPRVIPNQIQNSRLNSGRRHITKKLPPATSHIQVASHGNGFFELHEVELSAALGNTGDGLVRVHVYASSRFALRTKDRKMRFLSIGSLGGSRDIAVLAFSASNCSILDVPAKDIVPIGKFQGVGEAEMLEGLICTLLAESFVHGIDGQIWIHDADKHLVEPVRAAATRHSVDLLLSTSSEVSKNDSKQVFIHPFSTDRDLKSLLSSKLEAVVNLSPVSDNVIDKIISSLESAPETRTVFRYENGMKTICLSYDEQRLREILQNCIYSPTEICDYDDVILAVDQMTNASENPHPASVLKWKDAEIVDVQIRPVDSDAIFSRAKTYFLVGLTGDFGLSLCDWIVAHGARHVVISSRNPSVDKEIIKDLERRGAYVKVVAFDITDKQALRNVYDEIRSTMPPIGGVVNAAMVLNDKPFANMSLHDFEKVLTPKVNGTIYLDELFYSTDLEFFICFSSLGCITGHAGQSNYAAANMFMHALTRQRRDRGVASSLIDIASLLGVGYLTRNLDEYEEGLRKNRFMSVSEPDIRRVFAEAIVAGRPSSDADPEIVIGVAGGENAGSASSNPRFAAYVHHGRNEQKTGLESESSQSVESHLAIAKDIHERLAILQSAFTKKLATILQTSTETIDTNVPLVKLGIDSLVAVQIRSWFLKEIAIDMPVLKVLSGASIADICQDALSRLLHKVQEAEAITAYSEVDNPNIKISSDSTTSTSGSQSGETEERSTASEGSSSPSDTRMHTPFTEPPTIDPETENEMTEYIPTLYERTGELSHAQARIYFLHFYLEDKTTYNVAVAGKVRGTLDIQRLRRALHTVFMKHEVLRSSFFLDKPTGKPIQGVNHQPQIILEQKAIQDETEIQRELEALRGFTYNLDAGVTMRIIVLSLPVSQYIIFAYHHIIIDGFSWVTFLSDLDKAYAGKALSSPVQQSIDMAAKHRRERSLDFIQTELAFWKSIYNTLPETLPLFPFARVNCRPLLKAYDTQASSVMLGADFTRQVKQASAQIQITPFHFYLSAVASFISRCLSIQDFSIGILDANRAEAAEDVTTIGHFTNLLPLRFRVQADEGFETLARRTRDDVFAALAHSRAPFDSVLDTLGVSRPGNQNPLFQIAVNYRMGQSKTSQLGSCQIVWTSSEDARNPYDVIVDITETATEGTHLSITTQKHFYSAQDTERLLTWYRRMLEGFAADSSMPVSTCQLASASELQQTINLGRGDRITVAWPETLAHRVADIATQYPDSLAVKDGYGQQLSYAELITRADQIAESLRGYPTGSYIGLLLHPSVEAICTLIAIIRRGLVYVPLDLRNPEGRLTAIVSDCKPKAIICQNGTVSLGQSLAKGHDSAVLNVASLSQTINSTSCYEGIVAKASDPGFAIYTSGSTGTPKGVLLTHGAVLNQIWAISKQFGVGREVVLQQSSFGFDLSLEQIFSALANGGTLVVVSKEARGDASQIANIILTEGVTYTEFVPSEYLYLLRYGSEKLRACSSWKFAFSGGEKVTAQLRRAFSNLTLPNLQLINLYGPAEASLSCTRCVVPYDIDDTEDESPAGRVMPNYSVVVVDEKMKLLPVGFPGEICIAGAGNAVGYVNRPEETAQKFVSSQNYVSEEDFANGWTTLYRTGDKGCMLEDGMLRFLGRIDGDSQIKIRGMRIELDEIAKVLVNTSESNILDAVLSVRGANHDTLVAFVVFSGDLSGDRAAFLEQIKVKLPLPSYMCPTYLIPIDEIPRSPNGKKDRVAVNNLAIRSSHDEGGIGEHLTPLEAQIKDVWAEVLPRLRLRSSKISPTSDFFHVGGNSLLLLKLQAELKFAFGCHITLPELFQASTIRGMASRVQTSSSENQQESFSIDWDREIRSLCDGPSLVTSLAEQEQDRKPEAGLSVVLTGATGFLGTHILQQLVENINIRQIHCVAIRTDDAGNPRHVKVVSDKIVEYSGDLSDRFLGLSTAEFQHLSETADVIIHNGADVSFMKSYHSLRRPNTLSTRTLAEMALLRSIPIHFISTATVAKYYTTSQTLASSLPEISIASFPPPSECGSGSGYASSKWASEAILETLSAEHGLPVWIHRPSSITGEGAPELDIMATVLKYSKLLHAVPEMNHDAIQGSFDLVAVEDVARSIVATTVVSSNGAENSTKLFQAFFKHHCNDVKISPHDLGRYLGGPAGSPFDQVDMKSWLERARKAGLGELVYAYLANLFCGEHKVVFPGIHKGRF